MNITTSMISSKHPYADFLISNALLQQFKEKAIHQESFVFFCIGTPNISGDALGPIVGSRLKNLHLPNTFVYGTWEEPIHALNLANEWEYAKKKHPDSCFIAIDASFGPQSHLGNIFVENRPIYPGQGVGKMLPPVGDFSITDVVCTNCTARCKKLQEVPLSLIRTQANIILSGIFLTLFYWFLENKITQMLLRSDIRLRRPDHI